MGDAKARFTGQRQQLVERLFPGGIPRLWCPSLTHYADRGVLDRARMRAHLRFMHPWVRGFLVPGSTGEGWDMSEAQARELVAFMIDEIRELRGHLLIGILATTVDEMLRRMEDTIDWLRRRTRQVDAFESLARSSVCGFTVCPPSGSGLGQGRIRAGLERVLSLGLPVALYQLPQVTRNEMSPETVAALSAKFPGFYLFKDTSGADRVATSGYREAFLVRGAEGGYASHLVGAGGHYDGFLLSTANCFARQLGEMIDSLRGGKREGAEAFSSKLTAVCGELFEPAARVGYGNAFTNASKAMDHFFAHGAGAAKLAPPRLHSGKRLPTELIQAAGAALTRHGLMPESGYLGRSARHQRSPRGPAPRSR
jgi:dihydrodipicolinate synthase/N-acetylneuraminate lyase